MRYKLEPYNGSKSRFICPNCNSKQSFTYYIDAETNHYIDKSVGRCNKETSCGYHKTPKEYFNQKNIINDYKPFFKGEEQLKKNIDYIDYSILFSSFLRVDNNYFITFLKSIFDIETVNSLIDKYKIGASNHWNGATIFWQIDEVNKIRTGKIMLYNPISGKRVKEPFNKLFWEHKKLNKIDFNLKQTLFGMHLIKDTSKQIAIVESEKTAIICSVFYPNYIWLATGGINNLKKENFNSLKNRTIVLFPDLGAFEKWTDKAKEISKICNIKVSDILERNATETEKQSGYDLADYLLQKERQF